ncbi:MAG: potassium channel family protein [Halioglobus sp.]
MSTVNHQNNFHYLTASLILLLMSAALLDSLPDESGHLFLQAAVLITFGVSYKSLDFGTQWRRFVAVLAVLIVVSSIIHEFGSDHRASEVLDLSIMLTFFVGAAYRSSLQVLFSGKVDGNIISGSMAIYLLLGLIWSSIYLLILEFSPNAFNGMAAAPWVDNFSTVTYFSFVSLTTLGYGDISPAEPFSRVVVYLEAIIGVFYMAIVVASLIGAHKSQPND